MPETALEIIKKSLANCPPLMTLAEAAEVLRCSRRQLNRWISTGRLPRAKFGAERGHKVLVPRESVAAFVAQHFR